MPDRDKLGGSSIHVIASIKTRSTNNDRQHGEPGRVGALVRFSMNAPWWASSSGLGKFLHQFQQIMRN